MISNKKYRTNKLNKYKKKIYKKNKFLPANDYNNKVPYAPLMRGPMAHDQTCVAPIKYKGSLNLINSKSANIAWVNIMKLEMNCPYGETGSTIVGPLTGNIQNGLGTGTLTGIPINSNLTYLYSKY